LLLLLLGVVDVGVGGWGDLGGGIEEVEGLSRGRRKRKRVGGTIAIVLVGLLLLLLGLWGVGGWWP